MKLSMRAFVVVALLGLSLLLSACGGGGTAAPAGGGSGSGEASGGGATIEIASVGENLAYDKTELSATSGQEVTVRFQNTSAAQQHNWVLVDGGADVAQQIATNGIAAGADANYLPSDAANVIASTPLANANETTEVTFTAPEPGTYLYICTVPGHYPLMQGTLTVN
ncbi:MAG: auracyanin [Oscillochloris sp.]|nr:auracyanin [Oscillochloris sp.]